MTNAWIGRIGVIGILGLCMAVPFAGADSWVAPTDIVQASPSGRYSVEIHSPGREAIALLEDRDHGRKYNLTLPHRNFPVDAVLLDTGELVLFDEWHQLGFGELVAVCFAPDARDGTWKERWRSSLEDLLSEEAIEEVPRSVSSRWWRKTPLEWKLREDGSRRSLVVTLHNEHQLGLDMKTGDATWLQIDDVGPDPARLLKRADALQRQGENEAALSSVDRAIEAWGEEPSLKLLAQAGNILRSAGAPARTIELLRQVVGPTPTPDETDPKEADSLRWVWTALAYAHQDLKQWHQASAIWKHLMIGKSDPWTEVHQLAQMFFNADLDEWALEELEAYGNVYVWPPDVKWGRKHRAGYVGSMLEQRGYPELAVKYLALAWDPDRSSQFDGMAYARALESVGRRQAALEIWYAVHDKVASDPFYGKKTQEAIDRLETEIAQEVPSPEADSSDPESPR